jgi:hypothetical protein
MNYEIRFSRRLTYMPAIVLLLAGSVLAGPKIFVAEPSHDLGKIQQGDVVETIFRIENRGDASLELLSAKSSCGCTVPGGIKPGTAIAPGKFLDVPVTFNSAKKFGVVSSRISVTSNDPNEPVVDLRLNTEVEVLYSLQPKSLSFPIGRRGETVPRKIVMTAGKRDVPIEVLDLHSQVPGIKVEAVKFPEPKRGRDGYNISITLEDNLPLGSVSTQLLGKIKVGDDISDIAIDVSGRIIGDINIEPPFVSKTGSTPQGERIGQIFVKATKVDARVVAAASRNKDFVTEVVEHETGKAYTVNVNVAPNAPSGPAATTIDIFTTSSDLPVASVPVLVVIDSPVKASPPSVMLDGEAQIHSAKVMLSASNYDELKVVNVTSSDPKVTVSIAENEEKDTGNIARLVITLDGTAKFSELQAYVTVETDVPGAQGFVIPIRAHNGSAAASAK